MVTAGQHPDELNWKEIVEQEEALLLENLQERYRQGVIPRHDIGYHLTRFQQKPIEEILDNYRKRQLGDGNSVDRDVTAHTTTPPAPIVQDNSVAQDEPLAEKSEAETDTRNLRSSDDPRHPPGSRDTKQEKEIEDALSHGVEMTEARRARYERLMNGDFSKVSNELTRGGDLGASHERE